MKKVTASVSLILLLLSFAPRIAPVAKAADPGISVTGYTVYGVPGMSDVYRIEFRLTWSLLPGGSVDPENHELTYFAISAKDGSSFVQAKRQGDGYQISPLPLAQSCDDLNEDNIDTISCYFVKTGASSDLTVEFHYSYDHVVNQTCESPILRVVKTVPDEQEDDNDDDDNNADPTKYKPLLSVDGTAKLPLLTPETKVLSIPIKNSSIHSARNVMVRVEPSDKSKPIFNANQMSITDSISSLIGNHAANAEFNVSLAPGATTGLHEITLTYGYTNAYGVEFTSTETAYVQVEANNAAPRLGAYCATSTMSPGTETKTKFTIKNSGSNDARNIRVTLSGLSASGVSLRKDTDVRYLDKIAGQGSADVEFNLFAASSIAESAAMLQVKLDYTDMSGVAYSETNTIFLPLGAGGGDGQGVPRLIINRYSFGSQGIRAGSQFLLELDLQNTSRSKSISNLKVTVQSDDGTFLPVDASNTLFIEQILPQEVYSTSLLLAAKADAENKPYSLRVTFDYEATGSQALNSQEVISIPVQQNPRLMVNEPVLYGQPFMYQMIPINVEFYNLGKTILYNLIIKAEGPFQIEGGSYFVGNFNPGSSDSFNFTVTPTAVGPAAGSVVFSFEDSVGTSIEVRRDFSMEVMEMVMPEDPGMKPPMEPEKPNYLLYVGIGVGALLLVGGGVFFFLRRRKKMRLNLLRAEDMMAAAQTEIPEIEYVGFDQTEAEAPHTEAEPKE